MAARGAQSGGLERILDRKRYAMERAPQLAARERRVRGVRARSRTRFVQRADSVDRGVVARNTRKVRLDELARRDTARADRAC